MERVEERNNTTTKWYKVKEGNLPPFRKEVRVVYLDNNTKKYVYFNNYLDIDIYSSENVGVENVDDLVKSWKFNPGWNYEIIAWTYLPEYDGNENV